MSLVALTACSGIARRQAPLSAYLEAAPAGFPEDVMYVDDGRQDFDHRSMRLLKSVRAAAEGSPLNVLALSGGGAGVAFGAGALVGWTEAGTRPEFQIVTGVSAGALLAPLAFLGSHWDATVTEAFSGARTGHLLQSRWVGALFGDSVYRGRPLLELVDHYVTDELVRAVAAEAARGRLLLVATTDLDSQRTVIWDLGRIAAEGGEPARRLFRDVLVASASIPGVFPPVLIRVQEDGVEFDEMHVDGGTTAPLFIAPKIAAIPPDGVGQLRGANVYVIVNGQLDGNVLTTPVRTVSIVSRGLGAALESSSRAAVEVALSVSIQVGMTLRVSEIPDDYPYAGSLDMRADNMSALFNFGARCASQKELWSSAPQALSQLMQPRSTHPAAEAACPQLLTRRAEAGEAVASAAGTDTPGSGVRGNLFAGAADE